MDSIRGVLSRDLIVTLSILFLVVLIGSGYLLQRLMQQYMLERLRHDADALIATLEFNDKGVMKPDPARIAPVFMQPLSGHYFRIHTSLGDQSSRSLWDTQLAQPSLHRGEKRLDWQTGPAEQELLVYSLAGIKQGEPFTLSVAEDYSPVRAAVTRLRLWLGLAAAGLLAVGIAVQRRVVRAGLRPLESIRSEIVRLERGEISELSRDTAAEIRPLAAEINRLAGSMRQRVSRSRTALGNLAHALKGPLTAITRLCRDATFTEHPQQVRELQQLTDRIQAQIERELKRARIAGTAMPGRRADIRAIVDDLVLTLGKLYPARHLQFDSRIEAGLTFPVDHDDLTELLGNLLDNACKWAGHRVRIRASDGDGLALEVEDDGADCPRAALNRLTRRGGRVDEHRQGHGLGLAIVHDIVEQYGGEIRFDCDGELGGLRVRVSLPRPANA